MSSVLEAAECGDVDDVIWAIECGGNLREKDPDGHGVTYYANKNGGGNGEMGGILRFLFDQGYCRMGDETANYCIENNLIRVMMWLLNFSHHNVTDFNILMKRAVDLNRVEIVKILATKEIDVKWRTEAYGYGVKQCAGKTFLFKAEVIEVAEILIALGVDVNAKDDSGHTALMYSNEETCKLLIEAGADVNARDNWGQSALFHSQSSVKSQYLISAGAEVNICNDDASTVLMSFSKDADTTKILIDAGADVNAADKSGMTSLMQSKSAEVSRLLINAGADLGARNNEGLTALMLARDAEIAQLLIDSGADIYANVGEYSAADVATLFDKPEVAAVIIAAQTTKEILNQLKVPGTRAAREVL